MRSDDNALISVGGYLATRLTQLGVRHLFGLPGDFNLSLLDEMLEVDALGWVGSSNELNAAYSADGYARVGRRVGALATTFGVGELSALNGIAGSFAEDVPVLHIGGMPARASMEAGAPLHHTLLDGDFGHFVRMFAEVTVAQAVLDHEPGREIDRVLTEVLTSSRPGYLGIPLDVAVEMIPAAPLGTSVEARGSDTRALLAFEGALRDRLRIEPIITILAGPRVHRRGVEAQVAAIADLPGVRVASQSGSKAILDEDHPASLGTYLGATTKSDGSRRAIDDANCLVMVGTVLSDFTTGFFTHRYDPEDAIELGLDHARIGHAVYRDVHLTDSLEVFRRLVGEVERPALQSPNVLGLDAKSEDPEERVLDQEIFWREVQTWLRPDTTVVAEAGTAFYGALDLALPYRSDFLGQPVWSSIGFTIPAMLGAALARPDRRPVLFIGDGSAQLTVQELGQLFARDLAPVIFLLDNDGYTVERRIQSPDAVYQDVVRWNWDLIPAALGGEYVRVYTVRTVGELRSALAASVADPGGAFFFRVRLPKYDAPRLLVALAEGISATNSS